MKNGISELLVVVLVMMLVSAVVWLLWNWLVPQIIAGAPTLTYLHTLGAMTLLRMVWAGTTGTISSNRIK